MLVGAGGNAGNQSSVSLRTVRQAGLYLCAHPLGLTSQVLVIRSIATTGFPGFRLLYREAVIGGTLAMVLVVVGFLRVFILRGSVLDATAICVSLFIIVSTSVSMGALLPLLFYKLGRDPAHAGPTIQVVMDILGVWVTCMVCSLMLEEVVPADAGAV